MEIFRKVKAWILTRLGAHTAAGVTAKEPSLLTSCDEISGGVTVEKLSLVYDELRKAQWARVAEDVDVALLKYGGDWTVQLPFTRTTSDTAALRLAKIRRDLKFSHVSPKQGYPIKFKAIDYSSLGVKSVVLDEAVNLPPSILQYYDSVIKNSKRIEPLYMCLP